MTLMALPCVQDKADQVPHTLLGAICQQMLDLCLPVSAQIWIQAVNELQTRKRTTLEVAGLIIRLLRVCRCPMLLLIGEHCSPPCCRASSWAPADHGAVKGLAGLLSANQGCMLWLLSAPSSPSSQVIVSILLRFTGRSWLADEAHCFFQPGDEAVLKDIRNFFKILLQTGPRHVLYVITGSSMATVWLNIALMKANGQSLLTGCYQLNLPNSHSQEDMALVWQTLRETRPKLLECNLLEWAEPTAAILTGLALDWLNTGRPADLQAYAADFSRSKLVTEVSVPHTCVP